MRKIIIILLFASCNKEYDSVYLLGHQYGNNLTIVDTSILPVIFLCGQSNMAGGDYDSASTPNFCRQLFSNCLVFKKNYQLNVNNGTVQQLLYGKNNDWYSNFFRFGPETGIAYYISKIAGKQIAIVKFAYSGSKLVDHENNGVIRAAGYWQIDATHAPLNYVTLRDYWMKQSFAGFRAKGYKPYTLAFVWCQGEADAADSFAAYHYQAELQRLLNRFKADMRSTDSTVDDMQVIITRTHNHLPASVKYLNVVRQAQANIAATYSNAHLIDSDSWPVNGDHTHWTRQAEATQHAKAIADILIPLIQ